MEEQVKRSQGVFNKSLFFFSLTGIFTVNIKNNSIVLSGKNKNVTRKELLNQTPWVYILHCQMHIACSHSKKK